MAQVRSEDLGDALEHGVARQVAVRVVDVAEQVEVGHDQREGPVEALRAHDLFAEGQAEVPGVEESRLRVYSSFRLELRHRQRAVDQEDGREREWDQPGIRVPERGEHDAERREHELGREPVEGEEAGFADRMTVPEQEHRRQDRVVQADEDNRANEPGDREAKVPVRDQPVGMDNCLHSPPGRERRDDVVADVEALAIPGRPVLQPGRDVLNDRDQHHELGRE